MSTDVDRAIESTITGFEQTDTAKEVATLRTQGFVFVQDDESAVRAKQRIITLKAARKRVEAWWEPICGNLHKAWKAATGKRAEFLTPIDEEIDRQTSEVKRYDEAKEATTAPWEEVTETPKVAGLVEKDGPAKVRLVDPVKLFLHAAELLAKGDDSLTKYYLFNESYANQQAGKLGKTLELLVPGIEVFHERVFAKAPERKSAMNTKLLMTRIDVDSSQIKSVGYQDDILQVEFKGKDDKPGAIWNYANVPPEKFLGLIESESAGKYFNSEIKGKFAGEKVA